MGRELQLPLCSVKSSAAGRSLGLDPARGRAWLWLLPPTAGLPVLPGDHGKIGCAFSPHQDSFFLYLFTYGFVQTKDKSPEPGAELDPLRSVWELLA